MIKEEIDSCVHPLDGGMAESDKVNKQANYFLILNHNILLLV